jgi:UDP-GlcNAc:undecaprenyl-phosphate/decaprenyl-phosphate GlcNAc-1-phosphate transferase
MDTLLAVLRRSLAGVPVFSADRDHVHHRLLNRGLSHRQAVLVLYGVSFVLAGAALFSAFARGRQIPVLILLVVCSGGVFLRKLGYLQRKRSRARRSEAVRLRQDVRGLCAEVRQRDSLAAVWKTLEPLHEILPLAALELSIGDERFAWKDTRVTATGSMRVELLADNESLGELRVAWKGFGGLDAEKTAVELVGDAVGDALGSIRAADSNVIPLRRRRP